MRLTAQQLEQRREGIGSSDIAAIVGLNRWRGPLDVYLSKMGQQSPMSEAAEIGHVLERSIAELAARDLGYEKHDIFTNADTSRHKEHSWAMATIDFILGTQRQFILEVKNVGQHMVADWKDGAPAYVLAQVQWQMEVLDCDGAYVGALLGGSKIHTQHVARNRVYGASLLAKAEEFWTKHVVPRVPPSVDGSTSWAQHLDAMHPDDRGEPAQTNDEFERAAIALRAARVERAKAEEQVKKHENRLKQLLGDAPEVLTSVGRISWKAPAASTRTDWRSVVEELGADEELVKRHSKLVSNGRRFLVPRCWNV